MRVWEWGRGGRRRVSGGNSGRFGASDWRRLSLASPLSPPLPSRPGRCHPPADSWGNTESACQSDCGGASTVGGCGAAPPNAAAFFTSAVGRSPSPRPNQSRAASQPPACHVIAPTCCVPGGARWAVARQRPGRGGGPRTGSDLGGCLAIGPSPASLRPPLLSLISLSCHAPVRGTLSRTTRPA